jgi:hypothetical protein
MAERASGGIFVWALESFLLAMFAISTVLATQAVGGNKLMAGDYWVLFAVLASCVLNLALQTCVAVTSKANFISRDQGYLHKSVAQAHCCSVTVLLALYIIIMISSLSDLNWANAYYTAAPGLIWLTGSITLAFLSVLWVTSIAGSWAATASGDSNSLFCTLPTTSVICILYPVVHEIGNSGLMACTDSFVSMVAVAYANLAILTSFTLSILDHIEFDPVSIFPKFMRTVSGRSPFFRIYSLINGIAAFVPLMIYTTVATKVDWIAISVILSVHLSLTVSIVLHVSRFFIPTPSSSDKVEDLALDNTNSEIIDAEINESPQKPPKLTYNQNLQSSNELTNRRMAILKLDEAGRQSLYSSKNKELHSPGRQWLSNPNL